MLPLLFLSAFVVSSACSLVLPYWIVQPPPVSAGQTPFIQHVHSQATINRCIRCPRANVLALLLPYTPGEMYNAHCAHALYPALNKCAVEQSICDLMHVTPKLWNGM